jgi:lipoyl(octanoyl) transferase
VGAQDRRHRHPHGFEINCNADLSAFDRIVPCGIRDAGVTSLSKELGRAVTVDEVAPLAEKFVLAALEGTLEVEDRWLPRWTPSSPGVSFELAQH